MDELYELKQRVSLKGYLARQGYNTNREGFIVPCPKCGSTNHNHNDKGHFRISEKDGIEVYNSFSGCCNGGSIIDYFINVEGLSKTDAINKLKELGGSGSKAVEKHETNSRKVKLAESKPIENTQESREQAEKNKTFILNGIKNKNIDQVMEYMKTRGISQETTEKYNIFADANYIYIPTSEASYVGRAKTKELAESKGRYNNSKGVVDAFNLHYLSDEYIEGNKAVYICEGVFDALSLEDVGLKAIAINGAQNQSKLLDAIDKNPKRARDITFIISLDTDETGEKDAEKLKTELDNRNLKSIIFKLPFKGNDERYKDVNEFFLDYSQDDHKSVFKTYMNPTQNDTAQEYLDEFFKQVEYNKNRKILKTGLANLDDELHGIKTGLYVIGAISSLGKTTLISQVADTLASQGEKVIFFSLEQSKFELVAKSLSRQSYYLKANQGKSQAEFMNFNYEDELSNEALAKYFEFANNISYIEGNFDLNVIGIRKYIENYINVNNVKPIVIVDYLQILRPINDKLSDKQAVDYNVSELKRISRDNDIPIFLISSFNRDNYLQPVDFTSFKESGAIEYGADVVFGLQLRIIEENEAFSKDKDIKEKRRLINEAKSSNPREVQLVCLKNRNGKSYFKCYFNYYPILNTFRAVTENGDDYFSRR